MRSTKALLLSLALAFSAGCEFLVTFETVPENTTSTGGTGTGGTGGTTTGGTTTTGGGGGTGGCDVGSCPAPSSECKVAACEMNACVEKDVAEGMDAATQVDGDCKKNVCQGGTVISLNDDADLEDDGKGCTDDLCEGGSAVHAAVAQGTTCADSGGTVCDGAGDCVECNLDFDCTDPLKTICDPTHVCVQPHCMDGSKNADETDTDCGGGTCNKCTIGQSCAGAGSNCLSGYCDANDKCAMKSPDGSMCIGDAQCNSGHCTDGVCCDFACAGTCRMCNLPGNIGNCTNVPTEQDPGNECGGGDVCDGNGGCGKPIGAACAASSDCASNNCVDAVCCNTACNGACQACNLAGSIGACHLIPAGADPSNECAGANPNCNGIGACGFGPPGVPCVIGAANACMSGPCPGNGTCL